MNTALIRKAIDSKDYGYQAKKIDDKTISKFLDAVIAGIGEGALTGVVFDIENVMRSIVGKTGDYADVNKVVEQGAKSCIFSLVHFAAAISIHGSGSKLIEAPIDNSQAQKLPFIVLEDFLEGQTAEAIEMLWASLVEPLCDILGHKSLEKGRNIIMLRICNRVLRQLSKGYHTQLSGRVKMFMASAFPIR